MTLSFSYLTLQSNTRSMSSSPTLTVSILALLVLADLFILDLKPSLQNLFLILGLSTNFILLSLASFASESLIPTKHLQSDHNPPNKHFNKSHTAVPTVAHGEQHLQHVAVTKSAIRTTTAHAVIVTVEDTLPISFKLSFVTLYSFMSLRSQVSHILQCNFYLINI